MTTGAIRRAKLQSNHHHRQTNTKVGNRADELAITKPTTSKRFGTRNSLFSQFSFCDASKVVAFSVLTCRAKMPKKTFYRPTACSPVAQPIPENAEVSPTHQQILSRKLTVILAPPHPNFAQVTVICITHQSVNPLCPIDIDRLIITRSTTPIGCCVFACCQRPGLISNIA